MFNQTKLCIQPSISVAAFFILPCFAALLLIISAKISATLTIILMSVHLVLSYQFIAKLALLSSPSSILCLKIDEQTIYIEDKQGKTYIATPTSQNIVHPIFSLISFDCEEIPPSSEQTYNGSGAIPTKTKEIINSKDLAPKNSFISSIMLSFKNHIPSKSFHLKNRRHLFICRYNTDNPTAFRRARVWLAFNK